MKRFEAPPLYSGKSLSRERLPVLKALAREQAPRIARLYSPRTRKRFDFWEDFGVDRGGGKNKEVNLLGKIAIIIIVMLVLGVVALWASAILKALTIAALL